MELQKLEIETEKMQFPGITLEQAIQYFATLLIETDDKNKVVQAARLLLALHELGNIGRSNLLRSLAKPRKPITDQELTELFEDVQTSHVYVMADKRKRCKIGKADDPIVRRRNVSTGTPGGAVLVAVLICREGRAFEVETKAKEMLAEHRIAGGEWFRCTKEIATAAIRAAYREVFGREYDDREPAEA